MASTLPLWQSLPTATCAAAIGDGSSLSAFHASSTLSRGAADLSLPHAARANAANPTRMVRMRLLPVPAVATIVVLDLHALLDDHRALADDHRRALVHDHP